MSKARQLAQKPSQPTGRKNLIINGAMQVNQRGEIESHNSGYTVDRFSVRSGGSARFTVDDSTDVPSGEGFASSLHVNVTTEDTDQGTGDFGLLRTVLEGQDLQGIRKGTSNAKKLTLQFWIKSTVTGTYVVELYDDNNARQVSASYTVNTTNTWEKKILTFPADTTGAFTNDNNASLYIQWGMAMGTNFTSGTLNTAWAASTNANRYVGQVNAFSSTSNNIYLTGVQLEVGSVATEFEHRSYGEELELCKRYFERFNYNNGSMVGIATLQSTTGGWLPFYCSEKRDDPTFSSSASGQTLGTFSLLTGNGGYPTTTGSFSISSAHPKGVRLNFTGYSNLTGGAGYSAFFWSNGNTFIDIDAEL